MLFLALFSAVLAQPGIQQVYFPGSSSYQFGVASTVSGPNPCPAIIDCRTCTSAIGCVWSGTYCYQVVYQVTKCSSPGCATRPRECPAQPSSVTCNSCTNTGCPSGQTCNGGYTPNCQGTCQPATISCPYGAQYSATSGKCVVISCVADNACPAGYTCDVNPCARGPCPVVCIPPGACNACSPTNPCGQNQVCQQGPTPSTSASQASCVGTCVDSPYSPKTQACFAFNSCADCTGAGYASNSGIACVWSGAQCYPSSYPCRSRDCVTVPSSCPTPCNVPTCEACASQSGCVWSGDRCLVSSVPCTGPTCVTNPSQCQAQTTCRSLSSCTACRTLNGCWWMGNYCTFNTAPCDGTAGCAMTCDVQQPCNGQDCNSCVAAANCRWLSSSRTCAYNTAPCTDNSCASTQSQCSTAQLCYGVNSCLACARITGCMWYDNTCYSVPCQGSSCAQLGYTSQCPQPNCPQAYRCTDCTILDGCFWNGQSCVSTQYLPCNSPGCATSSSQCPASGCGYAELYDYSLAKCVATSCQAANACPTNYTCNTRNCGSALCAVVCIPPVPQCGVNEQWTSCASSTCFEALCSDNYATRVCANDCRSGCQCVSGFARGPGNICVPLGSCPPIRG